MLLPGLLLVCAAEAGGFGDKAMRGAWPERAVDAEWVLPRGRWVLGVGGTTRQSTAVRGAFGIPVAYDDARFTYGTLSLAAETGLSDRTSLYLTVPLVMAHLSNARGADVGTTALGDAHSGFRYQPWLHQKHALAFEVDLKSPSGVEWPANLRGGGAFTEGFLTGTGTTNAGIRALFRLRAGPAAFDAKLGFTHKFAGVVGYVIETGGYGNGWLKPGDEGRLDLAATAQLHDDVAITLSGTGRYVGTYLVGVGGPNVTKLETFWLGSEEQYTYEDGSVGTIETDPSGLFVDAAANVRLTTPDDRGVFDVFSSVSLAGADGRFFSHLGLEEFSPHPGVTFGAQGAVRW
jgi:hypothetical protein